MFGGAVGSALRLAVSTWCEGKFGATFPWGTFAVNVIGSFLIGLVFVFTEGVTSGAIQAHTRALLITGFLGGFTTFSAFSLQTLALFEKGDLIGVVANVLGSIVVCLAAVWAGSQLGSLVVPRL